MSIKEEYLAESQKVFQLHRSGADGFTVAAHLSSLVDRTLSGLWDSLSHPFKNHFAVIALGGYGRFELCPHSDFDLMLVTENERTKQNALQAIQGFLHSLWDAGFDIGHSVRTLKDCVNLYHTDVDSWASLLESRYVCGSKKILDIFSDTVLAEIRRKYDLRFVSAIVRGMDERHEKYGNSVKLLEPNMKNSAGGLRDLHNLLWIFRSTDPDFFSMEPFRSTESACKLMLEMFERKRMATKDEIADAVAAMGFLLRTRHETHYFTDTIHDTLDFPIQREIAKGFGYGESEGFVERFMREYFLHARNIFRLNQRLTNQFRKSITSPSWRKSKEQILDEIFVARGSQLWLRNSAFEFTSAAEVLMAFYWCGLHSLELSQSLQSRLASISRSSSLFTEPQRSSRAAGAVFLDILRLGRNVSETLMLMNDFDILGKYIPEWGELVAFFQHSMYHYYTADAHTLIALERAGKLAAAAGILGEVFRSIQEKEVLYLGILLHDIAKPQGIIGHELEGAEIAARILRRFAWKDKHGDVAFLIRNHLTMEQIAFRRNISDPSTVAEFASLFSRPEQLDLLYVLTYSDLSAVNKNVWTNWKEMLLQELYLRTHDVLIRNLPLQDAISFQKEQHRASIESLVSSMSEQLPRTQVEHHLNAIQNEAYIKVFSAQEIAQHIALVQRFDSICTIINHESSHSTVTTITYDAPFLLSNLCGVLSANDTSIFDAHIFTRNDGVVIDQFRVVDVASKGRLHDDQSEKIKQDLDDVLRGNVGLDHLFERHHRRWRRRPRPLLHPNIRIDVEFEDSPEYTIIDVFAPDTVGFLYKVTQTISKLGLNIYFAKIGTRTDGIVDSFYVLESDGKPIHADERKLQIKERILHTVHQLINVQLAAERA